MERIINQACTLFLMYAAASFLVYGATSGDTPLATLSDQKTVNSHAGQREKGCDPSVLKTIIDINPYKWDNHSCIIERCGDNHCNCCKRKDGPMWGIGHCGVEFLNQTDTIPALPDYVTILDLSHSFLYNDQITAKFFANQHNIIGLNMGTTHITMLNRTAFVPMRQLKYLVLNFLQHLAIDAVIEVLAIPGLRQLSVAYSQMVAPGPNNFTDINSSVCVLDWSSNNYYYTEYFDLTVFADLHNLQFLDLSDCPLHGLKSITKPFPKLQYLDLHNNLLTDFRYSCGYNGTYSFPQLEALNLARNNFGDFDTSLGQCPHNLKFLDLTRNRISYMLAHMIHTLYPTLSTLNISFQDTDHFQLENYTFKSSALVELRVAGNALNFKSLAKFDAIGSMAFAECPRLQILDLNGTNFHDVEDGRFSELFGNLTSLTTFSIQNSQVEPLFKSLRRFVNLTTLQLDGNFISDVPNGFFDTLKHLTHLGLSDNRITSISQHTFHGKTRKNLQVIDLRQNPFVCDCDLVWFTEWFKSEHQKFSGTNDSHSYKCRNLGNIPLVNFTMAKQACIISSVSSILIIVTFTIIILSLTMFSLVFRYRWHVRLVLYEAFRGEGDTRRQHFLHNAFDFDVFLSYASEDLPWVQQRLKPQLEQRLGLRVCDHQKDFIPGKSILANIADCVIKSKKIIMVFSKHFVRSQWCQFELDFCLSHVLEYDDALIVMCVDDVASRDMTSSMMALLKTTTYIQWADEADARMSFWGRLGVALHEIV